MELAVPVGCRPVMEHTEPGVVAVHAHPDDESIATGGLLARAVDEGYDVTVVTCTGGERGEVFNDEVDAGPAGEGLAELRREELAASLAVLGAGPPTWLGYRDSGMRGDVGNDDPASFWRAPFDEAVGRLVAVLRERRPRLVVTYDAFGVYGHPDHMQAHRVTLCAVEAAAVASLYPVAGPPWHVAALDLVTMPRSAVARANAVLPQWGLASPFGTETDPARVTIGTPDASIDLTMDVRAWLGRKREALACHASQLGPDSMFLGVPDDLAESMFGTEWFVRARGPVNDAADPLAGL